MSCGLPAKLDACSVLLSSDYSKTVTVPEAKQHQGSYTVYKIILQAVKAKHTIEETPLTFVAWKRFRDLYKLHRRVVIIHAQLYLKGVVPSFPKPDFFGRLEPAIVEERRQASELLLSFVVQNPVLCQCEAVVAFFNSADFQRTSADCESTNIPNSDASNSAPFPPPLSPISAPAPGRIPSESSDMSEDFSRLSPRLSNRSETAVTIDGNDLLDVFDPLRSSATPTGISNSQLLCEVMSELQVAVSEPGDEPSGLLAPNNSQSSFAPMPSSTVSSGNNSRSTAALHHGNKKQSTGKWRSKIADFFPRLSPSSSKHNVSGCSLSTSTGDLKSVKSESQICTRTKSNEGGRKNQSIRTKTRKGGSPSAASDSAGRTSCLDYVIQAAEFISSAQKAEDENAFDLAFTCYKSAVMLLLQGVQDEKDLNRRNAVRVKTAKYLQKAESLYATYIASDTPSSCCLDGFTSRFLSNFGVAGFQSLYSELSQYLVLKILGRNVQLVQDITSGERFAMKFLEKSCYSSSYAPTKILEHCVPARVSHMVKLVKFWDTETAIVLLLEFATGGRLWNRLGSYFKRASRRFQCHHENKPNEDGEDSRERHRSESADNLPTCGKRRTPCRTRSGSDPCDWMPKNGHKFSVASNPWEDEEEADTSLFGMYERRSMRPRCSTADSLGTDTAPPSAVTARRFSILYSETHMAQNTSDELEEFLLRKWIAQITVALGYLHSEGVICRDLNPDNLLLDDQDNILLTFFCCWSGVDRPFNQEATRMLYSAPEVDGTNSEPLTDAADWWSLGAILYEIATGMPLHVQCPHGVGPNAVMPLPDYLSVELRDLISRLIRYDGEDRLGSCFGGVDEIKMHPFFMEFDWRTVEPS